MESVEVHASQQAPQRIIYVCGAAMAVLVFVFALAGVVVEARELWRAGASTFIADAALRVGFGALIALLSALPYVLLARATRQLGSPRFFSIASVVTLAIQLGLSIDAAFLERSSTAPIAVQFIPLYLCIPVVAVWGLAALARWVRLSRLPK